MPTRNWRIRPIQLELDIMPVQVVQDLRSTLRLQRHKEVLESAGITDLSSLGRLALSGAVTPLPGLIRPRPDLVIGRVEYQAARGLEGSIPRKVVLSPRSGKASKLKAEIPPILRHHRPGAPQNIDVCYIAASELIFEDDTTVVLQHPLKSLTIIAEKLTIGSNVVFTWDRPDRPAPAAIGTPARPDRPPQATTYSRPSQATDGARGQRGNPGADGHHAPALEIWTLEMTGTPVIDLEGQPGQQGGRGGNGGPGAHGAKGKDARIVFPFVCEGPGSGGHGGDGGAAGDGGRGGKGGNGGEFRLYAPQPVISAYSQGFYATVNGGDGGPGGMPGTPGDGGDGGPVGFIGDLCYSNATPTAGNPGNMGAAGDQGPAGGDGEHGSISMVTISETVFHAQLSRPAIVRLSPVRAKAGDLVRVEGLRFTSTDQVVFGDQVLSTTVISDTELTFTVPAVSGGSQRLKVEQRDGTASNEASLYVLPVVSATPARLRPGATAEVTGTGFAPGAQVLLDGHAMEEVEVLDASRIRFRVHRPVGTAENPAGEPVRLQVALADGTRSNEVQTALDTLRMLVFGDSIQWGQGLEEAEKIHGRVEADLRARHGGIGVYKQVLAHSGAIIGVGDDTVMPALDGEVPTSYPTILQQIRSFNDQRETVDLILIDGGINDVDVRTIINPLTLHDTLRSKVEQHCHSDMVDLLTEVTTLYPAARVIVTGYYQILSHQSSLTLLPVFASCFGIPAAALTAAGVAATIQNCTIFADEANAKLQQAVDEVNATLTGGPRIFLAVPAIGAENAALAPDPFIYGIRLDTQPEDPASVAEPRSSACAAAGGRTELFFCERASVGHPNSKGALAYFEAIAPLLP